MLADRVRMGIHSEEPPIYLLESGTDSYLNWTIAGDASYGNSDFIHLAGTPEMEWWGEAYISDEIAIGNRNWLEITFSHDQQDPPFSDQETILFDISEFASKTITFVNLYANGEVRIDVDYDWGAIWEYLWPDMEYAYEVSIRFYSVCIK